MHKIRRFITSCGLLVGSLLLLSGCQSLGIGNRQSQTIRISSSSTTESQILANILSELITHETQNKVTLINNLGSSTVTHESLIRGDADIAASRYAGTELTGTLKMKPTKDPEKAQKIFQRSLQPNMVPFLRVCGHLRLYGHPGNRQEISFRNRQ